MLFTTAIGLDYVYRGTERMGLVAISLCVRTGIYAVGSLVLGADAKRIVWVPIWLAVGEVSGIALVWLHYLKNYRTAAAPAGFSVPLDHRAAGPNGLPDPALSGDDHTGGLAGGRIAELLVGRGTVRCSAPDGHGLAYLRPDPPAGGVSHPVAALASDGQAGREALDSLVEVLVTGLVPVAVGGTLLADPLVQLSCLRTMTAPASCWRWASGGRLC